MNMVPGADGSPTHTAEMWSIVKDYWLLGVLSGGVAFFVGLQRIKNSYKQRNLKEKIGNLLLSSVVLGFMAVGAVLLAPLVLPSEVSTQVELGIGIAVGGFGLKFFDLFLLGRFGLKILDPMSQDDMDKLRESLTPEARALHAEHCPFYAHGDCIKRANDQCETDGIDCASADGNDGQPQ